MADYGLVPDDNPVLKQIDDAAMRYGVNRDLAHVVAQMESGYNPNADSGKAQGVMQLTPATGNALGVKNRFDSAQNIDAGVRLLGELLRKYGGDTRRVLAAYDAGEPAVDSAGGVPNFPETQAYVTKGMGILYPRPPAPAPAQMTDEQFGLVPDTAATTQPAQPSGPSAFQHALDVLSEASGVKLASDLLGGGTKAIMGRIVGSPDQEAENRALGAIKSTAQGIAAEPERMRQQLVASGQAMVNGDINAAANHLWYAIPFAGAAGQQMAEYLKNGDLVGAFAHATGTLLPIAHEPVIGAVQATAEATAEAAAKTATAAKGAVQGGVSAIPAGLAKGTEYAGYGLVGGPHGAVTGFKIGLGRTVGKGAIAGAKAALADRAATIAADLEATRAAAGPAAQGIGYPVPQEPAPPVIPPGRQLEGPPNVIIPPQEDRSFVRAVPGEYATTEPGWQPPQQQTAPPAPPPAPAEPTLTLDDLARSLGGKKFSKLSEADQAHVRTIYDRIQNPLPVTGPEPGWPAGSGPNAPNVPTLEYNAPGQPVESGAQTQPQATETTPVTVKTAGAGRPDAQAIAAQLEKSTRADRITDIITRQLGVTDPAELANIQPHEWDAIGRTAGGLPPEADDIAQVRQNLADAQKAQIIEQPAAQTPATAQEQFQRKAAQRAPVAQPVDIPPGKTVDEALAEEMRRSGTAAPGGPAPAGAPGPTAADIRVETLARHLADSGIPMQDLETLPHDPGALLTLENLGRALDPPLARPGEGEIPRILDRVREIRGGAAGAPAAGEIPITGATTPEEAAQAFAKAKEAPVAAGPAVEPTTHPQGFLDHLNGISDRLEQAAQDATQRMRDRGDFSGRLNAGIPLDSMKDLAIWGAAKLAKGTVDFAKWSKEMLADAGPAAEQIRKQLPKLYADAQKIYDGHLARYGDAIPSMKKIMQMYRQGESGADWYRETRAKMGEIFGPDADMFVDFLAATSPNATVAANVALALKAYAQWKTGQPFKGFLGDVIKNLDDAAAGKDFGKLKVQSFRKNLYGDPVPVTVDRWIARAMGFRKGVTPAQYKFMDYTISQIANKHGLEPRQLQAAIWKAMKDSEGVAGQTGEPFEALVAKKLRRDKQMAAVIKDLSGYSLPAAR